MSDDTARSRRSFLSGGWLGLARDGAARAVPQPRPELDPRVLRPPGALPEPAFQYTCQRSGECVEACPARAIRVLRSTDPHADGTPHIIPNVQACVICEDLACMKACPSGALQLVPVEEIRVGLAELRAEQCVRTAGENCRLCVDKCPLGGRAIVIDEHGRVAVKSAGCVGCGVCEMVCPTTPRAIVIQPLRDSPRARR